MNRENQDDRADSPHGHRDRGVSTDQPIKEETRQTKPGSHDPEATGYEADKTLNRIAHSTHRDQSVHAIVITGTAAS